MSGDTLTILEEVRMSFACVTAGPVRRRSWRILSLVSVLGAFAGGCVDNDISLSIDKFVAPAEDTCIISPTGDIDGGGVYDARLAKLFGTGFYVSFVVTNN